MPDGQLYDTVTQRIGKQKGQTLAHAVPVEVLGITGNQHEMKKGSGDTTVFRRWLPKGGATTNADTINQWSVTVNSHLTQEGVTPEADTLTPQDITVQINQYSCLYSYTDKVALLYEDDIPYYMKEQTGERMGLVREMIRYGALKGCSNKFYAGGTSRATVDEAISLNLLRKVTRSLAGNRGKRVTRVLSPSAKYNTTAVEGGYIVFCHTDCEHDIRELPGFVPTADYGSRKLLHQEHELGSADRYRFICSPELDSIIDSGASLGSTGLVSTGGSQIDVYPFIVVAKDAWGDLALRGKHSFGLRHIPHNKVGKSDPLGQRGDVGSVFWSAAFVQNDGWMAVVEAGVTDL